MLNPTSITAVAIAVVAIILIILYGDRIASFQWGKNKVLRLKDSKENADMEQELLENLHAKITSIDEERDEELVRGIMYSIDSRIRNLEDDGVKIKEAALQSCKAILLASVIQNHIIIRLKDGYDHEHHFRRYFNQKEQQIHTAMSEGTSRAFGEKTANEILKGWRDHMRQVFRMACKEKIQAYEKFIGNRFVGKPNKETARQKIFKNQEYLRMIEDDSVWSGSTIIESHVIKDV